MSHRGSEKPRLWRCFEQYQCKNLNVFSCYRFAHTLTMLLYIFLLKGGLECPAYHGGWHDEAIKLRLNRYCKSTKALGLEALLSFDGCKGLADSFAACLGDGTCPECEQFSDGVKAIVIEEPAAGVLENVTETTSSSPPIATSTPSISGEVTSQSNSTPPVTAPTPSVSDEVESETDSPSCPSGTQPVVGLPECCVPEPAYHGDGACDPDAPYNTAACNYDGGDCCKETCNVDTTYGCGAESFGYGPFGYYCQNPDLDEYIDSDECTVSDKTRVGDGRCDAGVEVYNSAACNWDGGDCCEQTCDERYAYFDCGDPAYPYDCQNPDVDTAASATATTATTAATIITMTTTEAGGSKASTTTATTVLASKTFGLSTAEFVVEATDDATILKADPDSNFGLESSIKIKGLSSGPNAIDSIMKFTIPPSDGVSSASALLRVFSLEDSQSGGIFHLAPDPTLQDWWEGSVTWNTAPDWEDNIINIGAVKKDQWYEIDISEAITSLDGAGGILTIRIRSRDQSTASYSSRQGSNPPEILMSYVDAPSTEVSANADLITTTSTVASPQLSPASQVYFPSDDASIVRDHPDENHGLETELRIDQDSGVFDALVRFDMTNININSVTSATLRLYCIDGSTSGGVFATSTPNWNEESVTWSNAPTAQGTGALGTLGDVYAGEWYELDISKVFSDPPSSLSNALSIRISSESWNSAVFSSKEGSDPPQLVLEFGADQPEAEIPTSLCEEGVKICPDGTFLSRDDSNNCQFGSCPDYDSSSGTGLYYPLWGPGGSVACVDGAPPAWATGAYLKDSKEECCKAYSSFKVTKCLSDSI